MNAFVNAQFHLVGDAASFGASEVSFWKRGSFRSGSNIGSSRSSAGVSGTFSASTVYDEAGNVIETHEHKGDFREW